MTTATAKRATMDELMDFANQVRECGGANPLDALMPSVPQDSEQCLIARNLNFNCTVNGGEDYGWHTTSWAMVLDDKSIRDKIAERFHLGKRTYDPDAGGWEQGKYIQYVVRLPDHIGQVASDFDEAGRMHYQIREDIKHYMGYGYGGSADPDNEEQAVARALRSYSPNELMLLKEMEPYIEASREEAYSLATAINDKGEIIV